MLVKVPPVNSHQSPDADFHLSGSQGGPAQIHQSRNYTLSTQSVFCASKSGVDAPPRLLYRLVHVAVFVQETEPPGENAKARLSRWILVLAHSNFDSGDWNILISANS